MAKVFPLRGDLEGSSRLFVRYDLTPTFSLKRNEAEEAFRGIKA